MKQILIFCIVLFALPAMAQQDSIVYEKRVNTSDSYKGDSIYYKTTYQKQGETFITITEPFSDQDSLIGNVLFNNYTDASRQYREAILAWEAAEKGYQIRLRQAERQYRRFIGDWLLNGKAIKIDAKLEIDKKPIKILSDQQFTVEIDKEQRLFNRIKAGRWIAKDEKYKLERAGKPKNKK